MDFENFKELQNEYNRINNYGICGRLMIKSLENIPDSII
jgi:hypothetical protein